MTATDIAVNVFIVLFVKMESTIKITYLLAVQVHKSLYQKTRGGFAGEV